MKPATDYFYTHRTWGAVIGIVLGLFVSLLSSGVCAQQIGTSISADGSLPNANAMLDIQSPSSGDGKGLLVPRITQQQRTLNSGTLEGGLLNAAGELRGGAAQGLLVYQTDGQQGFYYNKSTSATPSWFFVGSGDFMANGSVPMTARLNMNGNVLTNVSTIVFNDNCVEIGRDARSYSSLFGSVAIGNEATARYRSSGLAIGTEADGDYNGIAIGYQSDGQYSNIAIGFASSAYSGYDRVAIGRSVTNRRNDSVAIRGTLYLDGGTGVLYRSTCGSGTWRAKAFTIDHPLDPENKVLRHFCVEGPEVWNVYAGNAKLVNGRAVIDLPDYYSALNAVGTEVYSLTPVGGVFSVGIGTRVKDNRFVILGEQDGDVSWTVKVLRNDPACLEDIRQRPVEQYKRDMRP